MKVGITGGGFVGSMIIADLLSDGYKVKCMDNFHKGNCDHLFPFIMKYPNFEFQRGDINHEEDVKEFCKDLDFIFNTAAIVGFPQCDKYQVLAKNTHTQGIKNLFKYRNKGTGFLGFSTDSVYGINNDFCDESTEVNPQSLYGITKVEAEKIILDNENTLVIRYSTGMGLSYILRNNLLVNDLVYKAVTEKRLDIFEPDVSRSFLNTFDMSRAAIFFGQLLKSRQNKYQLYNVGCDSLNYTKRELAELIKEKTKCNITYINGKDPDCRDYKISHLRQYQAGFKPIITMSETIDTLIKSIPLIEWQKKYQ